MSAASVPHGGLATCPTCGLGQAVAPLAPGSRAHCARCDGLLRRYAGPRSDQAALCFALGALLLFVPAYQWPILHVTTFGQTHGYTVLSGVKAVWQGTMWPLAVPVALASVVFPAALILVLLALSGVRRPGAGNAGLRPCDRLCDLLRTWAIVDVYLLAIFVTVVKLAQLTDAAPGPGAALFFAMVICLTLALRALDSADAGIEPQSAPPGPGRTFALALGALILFVPANIFPTLTITTYGSTQSATVLDGIVDLWQAGMWPLALIVLCASLLIPFFKIIGLMFLTLSTGSGRHQRARTRLYLFIARIGRWSMLDVYVISLIVAVLRFGSLADGRADIGSLAFVSVVIVTIMAARSFDPRLIWATRPDARRGE